MRTFNSFLRINRLAVVYYLGIRILENIWGEDRIEFRARLITSQPIECFLKRGELYDSPRLGIRVRGSGIRYTAEFQSIRININRQLQQLLVLLVDRIPVCPPGQRKEAQSPLAFLPVNRPRKDGCPCFC